MTTQKKTYTITDFKEPCNILTSCSAGGRVTHDGTIDINPSSILTKLIQEAGRWCRSFASDLFIDWRRVDQMLRGEIPPETQYLLFGVRENGVDHTEYILARYNNEAMYGTPRLEYRAIWLLHIEVTEDGDGKHVTLLLNEVRR